MNFTRRKLVSLLAASAAMQPPIGRTLGSEAFAQTLPPLPDWSGVQLQLWQYNNPFVPSEWSEPKLGGYDWKSANAKIVNGTLQLAVTEKASGQVISGSNAYLSSAKWEVDATLPTMKDGLIAAPLWLFNNDAHEEIDFEIVGKKGLQLTVWASVNNVHTPVWVTWALLGNLSAKRYRLGIEYVAGQRIAFFVDGQQIAVVTPAETAGGAFPNGPVRPYFDLWVAAGAEIDTSWAGVWHAMGANERRVITLHGYRQSDAGQ